MEENCSINIKRLIVHILDSNIQVPVLSDAPHPVDDDSFEFIGKHIEKMLKDDGIKDARFIDGKSNIEGVCEKIQYDENSFMEGSKEIASTLYEIMVKNPDVPSADFACCLFDLDGDMYLALLKFNYRPSYIHYVGSTSLGSINSIIKQKTALPGENQKIEEGALINLKNLDIKLVEKKYELNGEKVFYFSDMFLGCSTNFSQREKVKILKKATSDFNKKFFGEDFIKSADIKRAITESIQEKDEIDIVNVADNVFKKNPDMRGEFIEHIERAGIKDRSIPVSTKISEKNFKNHKIKTDTGIEINLPVDYYTDKDKIEFISNPDGTISIVLKNISKIVDY